MGLGLLERAVALAPPFAPGARPWFVTGGVAPDTLDDVLATGARRVVVVRAITGAADPAAVSVELARRLARGGRAVRHLTYLFVLAGCLLAAAPLEFLLGLRVRTQWRRLLLTLAAGAWSSSSPGTSTRSRATTGPMTGAQTSGVLLPGRLPLEELLFFLVIPVCAVLTIEAVRKVTGWTLVDDSQPIGAASRDRSSR